MVGELLFFISTERLNLKVLMPGIIYVYPLFLGALVFFVSLSVAKTSLLDDDNSSFRRSAV